MMNSIWSTIIKLVRTHLISPKISNTEPINWIPPNTKRSYCCSKEAFFGEENEVLIFHVI